MTFLALGFWKLSKKTTLIRVTYVKLETDVNVMKVVYFLLAFCKNNNNFFKGHVYITNEAMTGAAPIFVDDKGE